MVILVIRVSTVCVSGNAPTPPAQCAKLKGQNYRLYRVAGWHLEEICHLLHLALGSSSKNRKCYLPVGGHPLFGHQSQGGKHARTLLFSGTSQRSDLSGESQAMTPRKEIDRGQLKEKWERASCRSGQNSIFFYTYKGLLKVPLLQQMTSRPPLQGI